MELQPSRPDATVGPLSSIHPAISPDRPAAVSQLRAARVFDTSSGDGRRPSIHVAPIAWRAMSDTIIFLHIAKCGGSSFNRRLTTLEAAPPCVCNVSAPTKMHNGHTIVQPGSCYCPRAEQVRRASDHG